MSSEEDGADLMASFQMGARPSAKAKTSPGTTKQPSFSPGAFVSEQSSGEYGAQSRAPRASVRKVVAVKATPVRNRSQYKYYEPKETVESILREYRKRGNLMFEVKLTGGVKKQVRSSAE